MQYTWYQNPFVWNTRATYCSPQIIYGYIYETLYEYIISSVLLVCMIVIVHILSRYSTVHYIK